MNLVATCQAFVHVADRGSFTLGAAAARVPQSVASRRVAALEVYLGAQLFDRRGRQAALTVFGRDLLPSARRLVDLAETFEHDADVARLRPLTLAVPDGCATRDLARVDLAGRRVGIGLTFRPARPGHRLELLRTLAVRAALVAVPADEATWTVDLGVATADGEAGTLRIGALRPGRSAGTSIARRRLWLLPEDDVPHVRDRLETAARAAGLAPTQVAVSTDRTAAVAATLGSRDLLVCSPAEATALDLPWRPLAHPFLRRGYAVRATARADADRLGTLTAAFATCLDAAGAATSPAVDWAGA